MATTETDMKDKQLNADHNPKRLVIKNLSALYDKEEFNQKITQLLKNHGQIKEIVRKEDIREKLSYAFVQMSDVESAKKIIQTLNGHQFDMRPLKISYYRLNAREKAIAKHNKCQTQKKQEKGGILDKNKDKIPQIYKEKQAQSRRDSKQSQYKGGFNRKRFNNNYPNHHHGGYTKINNGQQHRKNQRDHFSKRIQFKYRQEYSKKHKEEENYRSRNKRTYDDSVSSNTSSSEQAYHRHRRQEYEEKRHRNQRKFTQRDRSYSPYQKKYYRR